MRLINTKTGKFVQILDPLKIPPYAILSHTWENLEQSYQDVVRIQDQYGLSGPSQTSPAAPGFALEANSRVSHTRCSIWDAGSGLSDKIRKACEIAHRDGYHYIWIDSCCIDKTSSSELSEAINSMFNWYRDAQICYAFLSDVPSTEDARRPWVSRFRGSRWFRRGWTLQELIAPRVVVFVSEKWDPIGTKDALAKLVQDITHIDRRILTHERALADESVAERMRWAARRETTRVEDQAYSLLGIFDISMPTLYGEGMYAFRRLQEEILQRIPDQSLFAWGSRCLPIPRGPAQITVLSQLTSNPVGGPDLSPFAPSPRSFNLSEGRITRASGLDFQSLRLPMEEYIPTPHGIRTKLCLLPFQAVNPELSIIGLNTSMGPTDGSAWHLVILKCQNADIQDHLLSKLCYLSPGPESNIPFLHVPTEILVPSTEDGPPRIHPNSGLPGAHGVVLTIPLNIVCAGLELKTVYLPRPRLSTPERRLDDPWNPATFELSLPAWVRAALQLHNYSVSDIMVSKGRTEHPPAPDTHSLTIFHASSTTQYRFQYRYAPLVYGPDRKACIVIEARVWSLRSDSSARPDLGEHVHSNTVDPRPPYASAIWADERPWAMDLPLRSVTLPASGPGSTDEVQLQLGLDLVAPGRYNIHIRVPTSCHEETTSNWSTRGLLGGLNLMNTPHTQIRLTMLGSVRRALEVQGYSVHMHLKHPKGKRGSSGSHGGQYSLVISNSGSAFSISIDYFHAILPRKPSPTSSPSTSRDPGSAQQHLLIAARVALRSSSPASTVTGSETYLDGPYVVGWSDQSPWQWCLQRKHVSLTTPNGEMLTLHLGLDLAWQSEYYLLVDIRRSGNPSSILGRVSSPSHPPAVDLPGLLDCLDYGVSLTLPGHVERALQEQGFGVRFRRAAKDDLHSCRLTLSHGNQVTIGIDFSNHLVSRLGDDRDFSGNQLQELTFRACVKLLSSHNGHLNDASHTASPIQVVEWVAWRSVDKLNPIRQRILKLRGRRRWHLPCKDVKLTLTTGLELTLRLGLYLVWPPEYCLIVEVISLSET